ncbi:MAG: hypothetical protein J6A60_03150 [Clostridia bacterium]|nr:hypothetical protein [Clostridia bacterium]
MNELNNALRVVNTSLKTVRLLEIVKKTVILGAVAVCGIYALKMMRK